VEGKVLTLSVECKRRELGATLATRKPREGEAHMGEGPELTRSIT